MNLPRDEPSVGATFRRTPIKGSMKTCSRCSATKPFDEFAKDRRAKDGRNSTCKECKKEYSREYYVDNKVTINARNNAYYADNVDAVKEQHKLYRTANVDARKAYGAEYRAANVEREKARHKAEYAANPGAVRMRFLKRNYGLTQDDYHQIIDDQLGLCANSGCFNSAADATLHVDHDHACCPGGTSCGKCLRGLLCRECNLALGLINDDPKRLRGLADYLEDHAAQPR